MNPSWTSTPKRELQRRKGSCTLESHLLGGKFKRTRGISRCREEFSSKSEYGKADQEPNGPSELWAQSPKIEMPGWGLGTETLALEVSAWGRAGVVGWSRDCLGGLETGLSSLMGQRLPGRLESRAPPGREQYAKGGEV